MEHKYKECKGKCPYCGSENIYEDTDDIGWVDNQIFYPIYCNDCNTQSTEYYTLQYINTGYQESIEDTEEEE